MSVGLEEEDESSGEAALNPEQHYAGMVTRAVAFTLDAAVINAVAIVVGVGTALVLALFHLPKSVDPILKAIAAGAYVLWTIGYFVTLWSTTGQTPGARVMQIRVTRGNGGPLKPRRALRRCIGVILAILPLCVGLVPILFDKKRRGFQDYFAGTLVVSAPQLSFAEARRVSRRAGPDAPRGAVPTGSR